MARPTFGGIFEPGIFEEEIFEGGWPAGFRRHVAVAREPRIVGVPRESRIVAVERERRIFPVLEPSHG
jgi:hypothetical protein